MSTTTQIAADAAESREGRVVLDAQGIQRATTRIAHEIVERNPGADDLCLVAIVRGGAAGGRAGRGAARAARRQAGAGRRARHHALPRRRGRARRAADAAARRACRSRSRASASCWSTTCCSPGAPCARRWTRCSTSGARGDPARGARRPRAPRAADQGRLRRQEHPDLARGAGGAARAAGRRARGGGDMKHLLGIEGMSRDEIERVLETAEAMLEISQREIKKVPTLRGRTVINLFFEASTRTRVASRSPPSGSRPTRSTSRARARACRRARRCRHGAQPRGDERRRAGHPPLASPACRTCSPSASRAGGQRRRRLPRAPDPGAARRVHPAPVARHAREPGDRDRRRHRAQPRRALEHPLLHAARRRGARRRPADHAAGGHRGARREAVLLARAGARAAPT